MFYAILALLVSINVAFCVILNDFTGTTQSVLLALWMVLLAGGIAGAAWASKR